MKKVAPQSTALYYYIASLFVLAATFFTGIEAAYAHSSNSTVGGVNLVYYILLLIGRFSLGVLLSSTTTRLSPWDFRSAGS